MKEIFTDYGGWCITIRSEDVLPLRKRKEVETKFFSD